MWLLVDYGNIPQIEKNRGLPYVIDALVNRIGPSLLSENEQVNVRLYDGWYDGDTLSKHAQSVAEQIDEFSPAPVSVRGTDENLQVRVIVELARSLISDPATDILHTYRSRGFPTGIMCAPSPFEGCANQSECPWERLPTFLLERRCPADGCGMHPKRIISRPEQKLVDTMLTADLIELCLRDESPAIASSDDDMWPGISLSLSRGATVIHLQTKPGRKIHSSYTEGLPERYKQIEAM